jgi:Ca-activated chloride channel family protein
MPWSPWLLQQTSGEANLQITQIDRSRFPVIRVYVSATDDAGEPMPVAPQELQLYENGQPIEADEVSGAGEIGPLTTMLAIDISGSMAVSGKLPAAQAAAKAYVEQMQPGDQAGLLAFDVETDYVQPLTADRQALIEAIDGLETRGDTAMFDALAEGARLLQGVAGRKAIIVLTDGMDNSSTATLDGVVGQLGENGLSISAIGLGDRGKLGSFAGLDEARLESMTSRAGGIYSRTADADELRQIYQRLGRALHSEYVITYTTALTLRDGVNRMLDVRMASSGATASQSYNPGGVIPEVPRIAPWTLFVGAVAVLAVLLLLPGLVRMGGNAARALPAARRAKAPSAGRVRLSHDDRPTESGRIRLR